jgi:hypothetical protein
MEKRSSIIQIVLLWMTIIATIFFMCITTNFKSATIVAFKAVFNGIQSKGCMFHLSQNIIKRLNLIGLKQNYTDDSESNLWINNVCALALCQSDKINLEACRELTSSWIICRLLLRRYVQFLSC